MTNDPSNPENNSGHRILVCIGCPRLDERERLEHDVVERLRDGLDLMHANGYLNTPFRVDGVRCLKACLHANSIAFTAPGKRTYLFGGIRTPADIDALSAFARHYERSPDGHVDARLWSSHLRGKHIPAIPDQVLFTDPARIGQR